MLAFVSSYPSKIHIGVAVVNKPSSKLSRPSRTSISTKDLPSRSHIRHGGEMAPDTGGVWKANISLDEEHGIKG